MYELTQQSRDRFPLTNVRLPACLPTTTRFSNSTRRLLSSSGDCKTGNPIDDCWRCDDWQHDRQKLALCGVGYGAGARGGYGGAYYVVTDSSDDSPADPKPGTLRHAVTRDGPLWIVFHSDMGIKLSIELLVTSDKTIDGRGAHVEIANGACITVQDVSHVIIHSLKIYGCKAAGPGLVMSNTQHVGHRERSDGDGISVFTSTNIWVDHTYLADCQDGLLDCIHSSTAISITNNYFENHDKVSRFGLSVCVFAGSLIVSFIACLFAQVGWQRRRRESGVG